MKLEPVLAACCVFVVQLQSISAEAFTCPSDGRYPDPESADCRTYYNCAWTTEGILVATQTKCPGTTVFDESIQKCAAASAYTCAGPATSTTVATTTLISSTESPNEFTCPSEGRHPDPESVDCRTYYLCSVDVDGNLVATLSKCPGTNIFRSSSNNCVTTSVYTCPNAVSTSTTEISTEPPTTSEPTTITPEPLTDPTTTSEPKTTIAETTTEQLPTTLESLFVCSSSGRFPNPEQSDCQTYKYCLQTSASTFQEYTFRCPAGSNFNPTEARCTVGYVCPKALTTTTTTISSPVASFFVCQDEGRFADPESCNRYIFCSKNADGTLAQYAFKCPPNSWFKPSESRCSSTYVCN